MSLLVMQNIDKSFFGKSALKQVCLDVKHGEIHALLGENGAGKTTLMNILYGIYTKDNGEVFWKGESIQFDSPKDAIDNRIGMVHQHFSLVPTLTVSQNITLGLKSKGYPFSNRKKLNEEIKEISNKYGLDICPDAYVSSLSVGEQQRVEIIKLLYRNAELLILDEPTAVLTPQEIENLYIILRKLREDGHSVIIITHRIPDVISITDKITVLRDGEKIATVNTKDVDEKELSQYMIGRQLKVMKRDEIEVKECDGLDLNNISLKKDGVMSLDSISLHIAPGQIIGVAGVDGNGQKDLAEVIMGIQTHTGGTLKLCNEDISNLKVKDRKKLGMGYISDDRHCDGLIMDMDLTENFLLRAHSDKKFINKGLINEKLAKQETKKIVEKYGIKTQSIRTPIRYLSGGNQQKLILARELMGNPKAIVAFQPTRGLDIGAAEFIHEKLFECRKNGCSILLISADLEEILAVSDLIAVMYKGKFMGILKNEENIDVSRIGMMMAGSLDEYRRELA
ncbi:ABC transporter ATP-binding protein [Natronincola ferrireducens]|uniref:Simple sugar transport system ATP-binding protein n=1 Tax=Natronincola ferrireducens TaxID=393762 RepID=A0A1G8Z754_9FIRM|nr:ABC transporter ATP-binding protein [Natronincola ferrireducens]SDK10817.1 simple sugar transport system ATP-binding protein [Natronincola ferrireducens]